MSASRSETEAKLVAWVSLPPPAVAWVAQYLHGIALDPTATTAMEADIVRIGPWYLPVAPLVLLVQYLRAYALTLGPAGALLMGIVDDLQSLLPSSIPAEESIPAADGKEVTNTPTVPQAPPTFPSPPIEPERDPPASTAPGDAPVEEYDVEEDAIAAAPGREAPSGTPPSATSPAEVGGVRLPAPSPRARQSWSPRRRRRPRPSVPGSENARSIHAVDGSVMRDTPALVAVCCSRCGTSGQRADGWVCEGWVCGVCSEPFMIGGEPVRSLDGLDVELGEVRLYCEHCGKRQPPLERLVCNGCSMPHDHAGHDDGERDHGGHDDGGHDYGGHDGEGAAEASVDAPVEFPPDGITIDEEIRDLLPQHSHDERIRLEAELLVHGCRDPLDVWQDGPSQLLLDGHLRHAICRAHHIPYQTRIQEFPDRSSAIRWAIENQLARRNVTGKAEAYLLGKLYNDSKRQGARTDLTGQSDQRSTLAQRMAAKHDVSEKTIRRHAVFADLLDQFGELYGAAAKNAVLMRGAKMKRTAVAQAVRLDAPTRDRILARIGQREAAVDVITEALGKRAVKGPQARAAEAEDAAGQVEVAMLPGEPRDHAEEQPDSAPPSSGPPAAPDAGDLDQHPVIVAMRNLETAVDSLNRQEFSPLRAQRLEQWLSQIQQTLAGRLMATAAPTPPTNEARVPLLAAAPPDFAPDSSMLERVVPEGSMPTDRPRLLQLSFVRHPGQALVDETDPSASLTEEGDFRVQPPQANKREAIRKRIGADAAGTFFEQHPVTTAIKALDTEVHRMKRRALEPRHLRLLVQRVEQIHRALAYVWDVARASAARRTRLPSARPPLSHTRTRRRSGADR